MATTLPPLNSSNFVSGVLGGQILDIITTGMYTNPLMAIREYIQNSVDSIDQRRKSTTNNYNGKIDIDVDGKSRCITILDNGIGVANDDLVQCLVSLGFSKKDASKNRGFRGIGRLGGLAYCGKLVFETRSKAKERVGIITWDGESIRKLLGNNSGRTKLRSVLSKAATLAFRKAHFSEPPSFFSVKLIDVKPFHKDELMNLSTLKNYISQVAPVPFDKRCFSFAKKIEKHLFAVPGYSSYDVRLNNTKVFRPYTDVFQISRDRYDRIVDVKLLSFEGTNANDFCHGWYAITGFNSSIPRSQPLRGIRVRQGNISIGNEYYLEDIFTERRFAGWHIGELHVNYDVKPNARRDDFEQSKDFERFLEQLRGFGKHLSGLCRSSSDTRSAISSIKAKVSRLENQLRSIVFIDEFHKEEVIGSIFSSLEKLEKEADKYQFNNKLLNRIGKIRKFALEASNSPFYIYDSLDGRTLRHLDPKSLLTDICAAVYNEYPNSSSANELIAEILEPFVKPRLKMSSTDF